MRLSAEVQSRNQLTITASANSAMKTGGHRIDPIQFPFSGFLVRFLVSGSWGRFLGFGFPEFRCLTEFRCLSFGIPEFAKSRALTLRVLRPVRQTLLI